MAVSKWNGVALSSINKINGVLVSNIAKINGISIAAAYAYLLDTYGTSVEAAYSLRRVGDSNYTGDAVRIREDGTNTETDIGFTGTNGEDLDTAAIATHCGANNGYIVKWYDQSGNANDLTQSTTANQPQIYNGSAVLTDANGNYAIKSNGTSHSLKTTSISLSEAYENYLIGNISGTTATKAFYQLSVGVTAERSFTYGNSSALWKVFSNNGTSSSTVGNTTSTTNPTQITSSFNGASSLIRVNGTETTFSGTWYAAAPDQLVVFADRTQATFWDNNTSEMIFYDANKSTDRANIESNISAYWDVT